MKAYEKDFIKKFNSFSGKHSRYTLFTDWVTMVSSTLIVRSSPQHAEQSEAEYMALVPKYTREELDTFAAMFAITVLALEDEPQDFLGSVFMQSELGSDRMGQFFTPYHLSALIAQMTVNDVDASKDLITMSEPACGSGGMVIAYCEALKARGINYQLNSYVVATDLSEVAARMAYIQLSLLGIPAHVVWGNTLSLQVIREWPTFNFWTIAHKVARWKRGDAAPVVESEPSPKPITGPLVQAELFSL